MARRPNNQAGIGPRTGNNTAAPTRPRRRRSKKLWVAGGAALLFTGLAAMYMSNQISHPAPNAPLTVTTGIQGTIDTMVTKYWPTGGVHTEAFVVANALTEALGPLSNDRMHESGWSALEPELLKGPGNPDHMYNVSCWGLNYFAGLQADFKLTEGLAAISADHPNAGTIIAQAVTDFRAMHMALYNHKKATNPQYQYPPCG